MGVRRASLEQKIHILDYYHALGFLQRRIVGLFRAYVKISTTSFCEWVKNESELRNRHHRRSSAAAHCQVDGHSHPNDLTDSTDSPFEGLSSCVSNSTDTDFGHCSPSPIPSHPTSQTRGYTPPPFVQMRSTSEPQASSHYHPNVPMSVKGASQQFLDYSYLTGLAPLSFGLDFSAREPIYDIPTETCPEFSRFGQMSYGPAVQVDDAFDFDSFVCSKTSMDDNYINIDHERDYQYRIGVNSGYGSNPIPISNDLSSRNTYGDARPVPEMNYRQDMQYAHYSIENI